MRNRRLLYIDATRAVRMAKILASIENRWYTRKQIQQLSGVGEARILEILFMMTTAGFLDVFSKYRGGIIGHYLLFRKRSRGNDYIALVAHRMQKNELPKDDAVLNSMWAEVGDYRKLLSPQDRAAELTKNNKLEVDEDGEEEN